MYGDEPLLTATNRPFPYVTESQYPNGALCGVQLTPSGDVITYGEKPLLTEANNGVTEGCKYVVNSPFAYTIMDELFNKKYTEFPTRTPSVI